MQVMEVCLAKKRSLVVKRARFSALIHRELVAAVANLGEPVEICMQKRHQGIRLQNQTNLGTLCLDIMVS